MSDPTETELKLEPDAIDDRLAGVFGSEAGTVAHLVSTYFDTPDGKLRKAGFTLRVRRQGDCHVQTIKADGGAAAGLFVRHEWEVAVAGDRPEVDLAASPLGAVIDAEDLADLAPVFVTDITRTLHVVAIDGATIEVAVDEGAIRAGQGSEPIREIELELRGGAPRALFLLAHRIDEAVPVRLGVRAKSERGHRLAADKRTRASKAEAIALDPEASVADAFAAIAWSCLRQFRLNEPLLAGPGAEPVHQARVGLRRLRSAFSLFRPLFDGDPRARHLRDELRWLAGLLGEVRDLDVLAARLEGKDRAMLVAVRAVPLSHARAMIESARARRLMLDCAEWLALGEWREHPAHRKLARRNLRDFAGALLDRHRKRLKRRGKRLATLDDEDRHAVRIEAKKLRYAAEFLVSLYPSRQSRRRYKAFRGAIAALQEELGELNDHATAPALLARHGIAAALPGGGDQARARTLDRAEEAYEALIDAKRFWR